MDITLLTSLIMIIAGVLFFTSALVVRRQVRPTLDSSKWWVPAWKLRHQVPRTGWLLFVASLVLMWVCVVLYLVQALRA